MAEGGSEVLSFLIEAYDMATPVFRRIQTELATTSKAAAASMLEMQKQIDATTLASGKLQTATKTSTDTQMARTAQLTKMSDAQKAYNAQLITTTAETTKNANVSKGAAADAAALAASHRGVAAASSDAADAHASHASNLQAVGSSMSNAGQRATNLGRTLSQLSLPIAAISAVSLDMFMKFQGSMERLHTQAGYTQGSVNSLSSQVLQLAPSVGQTPAALADGLYHVASVGIQAGKAMDVITAAAKGAAIGGANMEDTANLLATTMHNYPNIMGGASGAMGILNEVVGVGNVRMQALIGSLGQVVPQAKLAGLQLNQVGAAMAILTRGGMTAEMAATRLRMGIALMYDPTAKATAVLADLGLSHSKLAEDMAGPGGLMAALTDLKQHLDATYSPNTRLTAQQAAKDLTDYSNALKAAGVNGAAYTKDINSWYGTLRGDIGVPSSVLQGQAIGSAFGGARSGSGITALIQNLGQLPGVLKQIGGGQPAIDKLNASFKDWEKTTQGQFAMLKAGVDTAVTEIGGSLAPIVLPVLKDLADGAVAVGKAFDGLPGPVKDAVVGLLAVGLVAGPMLVLIGNLSKLGGAAISTGGWIANKLSPAVKTLGTDTQNTADTITTKMTNATSVVGTQTGKMRASYDYTGGAAKTMATDTTVASGKVEGDMLTMRTEAAITSDSMATSLGKIATAFGFVVTAAGLAYVGIQAYNAIVPNFNAKAAQAQNSFAGAAAPFLSTNQLKSLTNTFTGIGASIEGPQWTQSGKSGRPYSADSMRNLVNLGTAGLATFARTGSSSAFSSYWQAAAAEVKQYPDTAQGVQQLSNVIHQAIREKGSGMPIGGPSGFAGNVAQALGGGGINVGRVPTGMGDLALSKNQLDFVAGMAKATGLDPAVLAAWLRNEEPAISQTPNSGPYNFLNIGMTGNGNFGTGDPVWKSNPATAGYFSGLWLMGKWAPSGYGTASGGIQAISSFAGQSPAAQISAIQHSGWAQSGEPLIPGLYQKAIAGSGVTYSTTAYTAPGGGGSGAGAQGGYSPGDALDRAYHGAGGHPSGTSTKTSLHFNWQTGREEMMTSAQYHTLEQAWANGPGLTGVPMPSSKTALDKFLHPPAARRSRVYDWQTGQYRDMTTAQRFDLEQAWGALYPGKAMPTNELSWARDVSGIGSGAARSQQLMAQGISGEGGTAAQQSAGARALTAWFRSTATSLNQSVSAAAGTGANVVGTDTAALAQFQQLIIAARKTNNSNLVAVFMKDMENTTKSMDSALKSNLQTTLSGVNLKEQLRVNLQQLGYSPTAKATVNNKGQISFGNVVAAPNPEASSDTDPAYLAAQIAAYQTYDSGLKKEQAADTSLLAQAKRQKNKALVASLTQDLSSISDALTQSAVDVSGLQNAYKQAVYQAFLTGIQNTASALDAAANNAGTANTILDNLANANGTSTADLQNLASTQGGLTGPQIAQANANLATFISGVYSQETPLAGRTGSALNPGLQAIASLGNTAQISSGYAAQLLSYFNPSSEIGTDLGALASGKLSGSDAISMTTAVFSLASTLSGLQASIETQTDATNKLTGATMQNTVTMSSFGGQTTFTLPGDSSGLPYVSGQTSIDTTHIGLGI